MTTSSPVLPVDSLTKIFVRWLRDTVHLTARGAWLTLKWSVLAPFQLLISISDSLSNENTKEPIPSTSSDVDHSYHGETFSYKLKPDPYRDKLLFNEYGAPSHPGTMDYLDGN